jgi:hypothetical protein
MTHSLSLEVIQCISNSSSSSKHYCGVAITDLLFLGGQQDCTAVLLEAAAAGSVSATATAAIGDSSLITKAECAFTALPRLRLSRGMCTCACH